MLAIRWDSRAHTSVASGYGGIFTAVISERQYTQVIILLLSADLPSVARYTCSILQSPARKSIPSTWTQPISTHV